MNHKLRLPLLLAKGWITSVKTYAMNLFLQLILFRPAAARKFVDEGITSLEGYYCSIFAVHMSFYIALGLMSQTYNLILIISTY